MKCETKSNPTKKWAIVDDEPAVLEVMQAILATITNCEVLAFGDPVSAIAEIRCDPDAFEMLITDRNMPELDGVGLLVLAREVAPHLRFVMVTGNTFHLENDLDRFDLPHSFISKPFHRTKIANAISRAASLGQNQNEPVEELATTIQSSREPALQRQTSHGAFDRAFRFGLVSS
jgi:DNA-binding NtrC family response regulator